MLKVCVHKQQQGIFLFFHVAIRRCRCLILLLVFLLTCSVYAQVNANSVSRYEDGVELIFSVSTKQYGLGELFAVQTDQRPFAEFNEFIGVLDFPIQQSGASFDGWFINENNTLKANFDEASESGSITIYVAGNEFVLASDEFYQIGKSYFVSINSLSQLFGLNVEVDFENLELRLNPNQPLPVQQAAMRSKRNLSQMSTNDKPIYPKLRSGYRILSPQSLDLQLGAFFSKTANSQRYSVIGGRDFALLNTRFFLSGFNDDLLNSSQILFSRESKSKDLLGFLNASKVYFGDVTPVRAPGLATSAQGRGLFISNQDLSINNDFDVTNLAGEIEQGWDVELYRNNILIDRQLNVQNGRYEFNDIPLLYGNNLLELRFFGPQGQLQVETYEKLVDRDLQTSKNLNYELSITQSGTEFLTGNKTFEGTPEGINIDGAYSTKIYNNMVLNLGHSSLVGSQNDRHILSLGTKLRLFETLLLNLDVAGANDKSKFIDSSLRTRVFDQDLRLSYRYQNDTIEETRNQQLSLINSSSISLFGSQSLSYQNTIELAEAGDLETFRIANSIGTQIGITRLNHSLEYIESTNKQTDVQNDSLFGNFGLQTRVGPFFSRVSVNYIHIDSGLSIDTAQAELDYDITEKLSSNFRFTRRLEQNINRYSLGFEYKHDHFFFGLNSFYDDLGSWSISANARMSLGYEDTSESLFVSTRTQTSRGTIYVRAFIDENANAEYEIGEPLLPGIKFKAIQSSGRATTDESGIAMLEGLQHQKVTDITYDQSSLESPDLTPWLQGISITPRAALSQTLDFPFVRASEIDGLLLLDKGNEKNEIVSNASIKLTNTITKKTYETRTAFDGYFYLSEVLPGTYYLEIADNLLAKYYLKKSPQRIVTVPIGSHYLENQNLIIKYPKVLNGYLSYIAEFENKGLASFFVSNLNRTSKITDLRIIDNAKANRFLVSAGFYSSADKAEMRCALARLQKQECQVIDYTSIRY